MKRIFLSLSLSFAIAATAVAQDLPKPSPQAEVEQRIGLTDIEIEYSRPGIKGRTVWGDLVPYNELWRTGANKATKISVSTDVIINGELLPKGEYSLFVIPRKDENWEVVFNKETELWGTSDYKEEMDQLRISAPTTALGESVERLEFRFLDFNNKGGVLAMEWANTRLIMKIEADPSEQALINIRTAMKETEEDKLWMVYRTAAGYANDEGMYKEGLEWIAESVKRQENWYSYYLYGQLLAANGQSKEAVEKGNMAIKLGKAASSDGSFSYEARISEDIQKWKQKK